MLHVHSLEMVRLLDERLQSSLTAHFAQQEDLIRRLLSGRAHPQYDWEEVSRSIAAREANRKAEIPQELQLSQSEQLKTHRAAVQHDKEEISESISNCAATAKPPSLPEPPELPQRPEQQQVRRRDTAVTMKWIRRAPLSALWMGETWRGRSFNQRLRSFMKGPFDVILGAIVILNISFMVLLTEWSGSVIDQNLGLSEPAPSWFSPEFFSVTEYVFFVVFLLDVVAKVCILRHEWYYSRREGVMYLNIFDALLVVVNFVELILLPSILQDGAGELRINHVRVIKLLRMGRTLRIVKTLSIFLPLRVLVGTCVASLGAFFWSLILLLVLKITFALIVSQALQSWILDETQDMSARLQIHAMYGSFLKATYTMFEITYSGGWPTLVRPVLDLVDPMYAAAFLPYVTLVVFAVLRIVTALFLKETLESAAQDAEIVIEETRRTAIKYQEKLVELFNYFDDDADGHLSPEEFIEAMSLPSVQQYLRFLDVGVRDVRPLFDILSDGNGLITISEFCKGLMQLKGQARALDMVLLQHDSAKLLSRCEEILSIVSRDHQTAGERVSKDRKAAVTPDGPLVFGTV